MIVKRVSQNEWTKFNSDEFNFMRGLVFSPSGRWAVDPKKESNRSDAVFIIDMSTLSCNKYEIKKQSYFKKIIDVYWVSEFEFVLVDYNLHEKNFNQIYCHVDHEKCRVVPFFRDLWQLPSDAETRLRVPGLRGAGPVHYKGKQYYMILRGSNLIFVRWNKFYQDDNNETLQITVPTLHIGSRFETYELAFSHGSTIYMPLLETLNHSEICTCYRHAVDRLIKIDLNKIDFVDGCANMNDNYQAIDRVRLKVLQGKKLRRPDVPLQYRQIGDHLLAYTTVKSETSTNKGDIENKVFMMNLKEMTIGSTKLEIGPHYFPTVYRNQLLVVRNDLETIQNQESWSSKFAIKQLVRTQVLTLAELAQAANVRYSTTSNDPVMVPFVFPRAHCCSHNVRCFCQGIVGTKYAANEYAGAIQCGLEDSD